MEFEKELSELRVMHQKNIDMLKVEVRAGMHKQVAMMKVVNSMADTIAERNLLIEELCECIGDTAFTQRARKKIQ